MKKTASSPIKCWITLLGTAAAVAAALLHWLGANPLTNGYNLCCLTVDAFKSGSTLGNFGFASGEYFIATALTLIIALTLLFGIVRLLFALIAYVKGKPTTLAYSGFYIVATAALLWIVYIALTLGFAALTIVPYFVLVGGLVLGTVVMTTEFAEARARGESTRTLKDLVPYLIAAAIRIVAVILLGVCLWLCFAGQKINPSTMVDGKTTVEWSGMVKMIIGTCGMLALVFLYNLPFWLGDRKSARGRTKH